MLVLGASSCAHRDSNSSQRSEIHSVPIPAGYRVADHDQGMASWYGGRFHGRRTASGEHFDKLELSAAHRKLSFGTLVRVTRVSNGAQVIVRINDRGPHVRGRIIDLSRAAAEELDLVRAGVGRVELEVLEGTSGNSYGLVALGRGYETATAPEA